MERFGFWVVRGRPTGPSPRQAEREGLRQGKAERGRGPRPPEPASPPPARRRIGSPNLVSPLHAPDGEPPRRRAPLFARLRSGASEPHGGKARGGNDPKRPRTKAQRCGAGRWHQPPIPPQGFTVSNARTRARPPVSEAAVAAGMGGFWVGSGRKSKMGDAPGRPPIGYSFARSVPQHSVSTSSGPQQLHGGQRQLPPFDRGSEVSKGFCTLVTWGS